MNNFCLFNMDIKLRCMFDSWSFHHFFWQGFAYILLHLIFNIKNIYQSIILLFILSIIHIIEEYLGNTNKISLEGLFIDYISPLFDNKIKIEKRKLDGDTIRNSIGDILSGIISNIIIILYWYYFKKLPFIYLLGIIPIYFHLKYKAKILY